MSSPNSDGLGYQARCRSDAWKQRIQRRSRKHLDALLSVPMEKGPCGPCADYMLRSRVWRRALLGEIPSTGHLSASVGDVTAPPIHHGPTI